MIVVYESSYIMKTVDYDLNIQLTFFSLPGIEEYFERICFLRNKDHFLYESSVDPSVGGPLLLQDCGS
jgi:hypothetical protein